MVSGLQTLSQIEDKSVIESEQKATTKKAVPTNLKVLKDLGFNASHVSMGKLGTAVARENATYADLMKLCEELIGRLKDEAKGRTFFALSLRETEYHNSPRVGWEQSIERFPQIVGDVEEASKCFALSRNAAAVHRRINGIGSFVVAFFNRHT